MAFMLYERGLSGLAPTGKAFRLAGYNLIHAAWIQHDRPIDVGWHITANKLIALRTGGTESISTRSLLIDFDPHARWRIGIIELLGIYAYTSSEGTGQPVWSPLMLRLRDVFYNEYDPEIDDSQKEAVLGALPDPKSGRDFVEFLYLTGPWNWGKNGMTNAAFIQGPARDYFRKFF